MSAPTPPTNESLQVDLSPRDLKAHLEGTYFALRVGLALLAFCLPLVLPLVAKLRFGVGLQGSLSAYYHAAAECTVAGGVVRDAFVGLVVAIGVGLFLYRGYSRREDWVLNLAGLCAVGVAWVPTGWTCTPAPKPFSLHLVFAVLFFVCIAYVCLFLAKETLGDVSDDERRARYTATYRVIGGLMLAMPAGAILADRLRNPDGAASNLVYFLELGAVWVFGLYWAVKSKELRESSLEQKALSGRAARVKIAKPHAPDEVQVVGAHTVT